MEIEFKNVGHIYQKGTPFERTAIFDMDLAISSHTFLAVIGHTGSGKSTLMQHINGLLKPTQGEIRIGDFSITAKKKNKELKRLRKKVGMVFQYPEHQLFEETVEKDICFAPLNFGINEDVAKKKAREVLKKVGLSEDVLLRSPFDLSGGQKRRVAIAGVLVMEPEILVLDEPTAGLDPRGRQEIMGMFKSLHHENNLSTILVTHSMEDAANYADEILVMHKGTTYLRGTPKQIFKEHQKLREVGLDIPESVEFMRKLEERFSYKTEHIPLTVDELANNITSFLNNGDYS